MSSKSIYALSVGVNSYKHLARLSCAKNDAEDFAATLRDGLPRSEVKLLLDAAATKESIMKGLAWLADSADVGDTSMLFFSGHGGRQSTLANDLAFLCPAEASLLNLEQTCVTNDELSAALRAIRSERLVVLLDTCYSGGMGQTRQSDTDILTGLTSHDVSALINGSGRMILAASCPEEPAWELSGMHNGLFTSYVLRALRGDVARADGSIWASDIFGYVSRGVRQHGHQRPYQHTVGEDFVIMIQYGGTRHPLRATALSKMSDQRSLRLAMHRFYNRAELSLLCRDLGVSIEDLPGVTFETQLMDLIDHCHRRGRYDDLLERIKLDRPQLTI